MMLCLALLGLVAFVSAHFKVEYPIWRGDSFLEGSSQYSFPCANISETTDPNNRTQWPPTGGSLRLHVSHPWALTYVNLGLGTNVKGFNISLVDGFNQTGNGTFCLKETGRANLEAAIKKAGLDAAKLEGTQATLQVVQVSHTGAGLFNCADITFNSSAPLLEDKDCKNSTGVGGVGIENEDADHDHDQHEGNGAATESGGPKPTGAAALVKPAMGVSVVAVMLGLMFAVF